MTLCCARQFSDQMLCMRCDQGWDINDPDPPKCKDNPSPALATMGRGFMELSGITDLHTQAERMRPGVVKLSRMIARMTIYNTVQALDIAVHLYDAKLIEINLDGHCVSVSNPYYKGGQS